MREKKEKETSFIFSSIATSFIDTKEEDQEEEISLPSLITMK